MNELPEHVFKIFQEILEENTNMVGEKPLDKGYFIKKNKDRATISHDDDSALYVVRFIRHQGKWKIHGKVSAYRTIPDFYKI